MNNINLTLLTEKNKDTYFNMIKQLSDYTKKNENKMININNRKIYLLMKEDEIIGTGSIFILVKYHCDNICLIEDIVIDKKYRNNGYGKKLIELLVNESKKYNCYKTILDCKEKTKNFYEKCDFAMIGYNMSLYN